MKNKNIISQQPHNKYCKLIKTSIFNGTSFLDLVYGIENNGTNEGLEVYYKKESNGHFHKSRRFDTNNIPTIYKGYFFALKKLTRYIKEGHKGTIPVTTLLGS